MSREQVLSLLLQQENQYVSGEAMSRTLGISRAAVWKAIRALEAQGHHISAMPGRGYCLEADSDILTEPGIRSRMENRSKDIPIRIETTVDSTNTRMKKLAADGWPHGSILLADTQTGGRGRMGRSFYSPAGTGLYMSILLRPDVSAEELPLVTIAAAAAVSQAIEKLSGCFPQVKWVNDVLVNGKKVSGILTEGVGDLETGTVESVIVGIGINVCTAEASFPPPLRQTAGSLPGKVSRCALAAEVASRLLYYTARLAAKAYLEDYRRRSLVLGKMVSFRQKDGWHTGQALDIDDAGRLVLDGPTGRTVLRAGEIRLS